MGRTDRVGWGNRTDAGTGGTGLTWKLEEELVGGAEMGRCGSESSWSRSQNHLTQEIWEMGNNNCLSHTLGMGRGSSTVKNR